MLFLSPVGSLFVVYPVRFESGIFVVSVTAYSAPIVNPLFGAGLISAGTIMIWNSLNDLWTDHEVELFELQQLTNRAKAVE